MNGITETEVFALIGRLYAENQILRQQLISLQAQTTQAQANSQIETKEKKDNGILASLVSGEKVKRAD